MQDYPVYTVEADGSSETGLTVELRVELGAGGGLEGLPSAEAVVQALVDAATQAGAINVSSTCTNLSTTTV